MARSGADWRIILNVRLDSWKEIATHLNRGVRTVQRWEQNEGLPVHRLAHEKKGSVYAESEELDAWWNRRGNQLAEHREEGSAGWRRIRFWIIGGIGAAVVAAAMFLALRRPFRPSPRVVALTSYRGVERSPAFSPDGSRVAFSWNPERDTESASYTYSGGGIYVLTIGTSSPPLRVTQGETDNSPAWSPDGRFLSFYRGAVNRRMTLLVVPALGGPERRLAEVELSAAAPGPQQAWTPDGKWIISRDKSSPAGPFELVAISVESGERHRLTSPAAGEFGDGAPAVSRDGRTLAFVRASSPGFGRIYSQPLFIGHTTVPAPKQLTRDGEPIRYLLWAGRDLLFISGQEGFCRLWWLSRTGAVQLVPNVGEIGTAMSISPTGDRLAYDDFRVDFGVFRQDLPLPGQTPGPPVRLAASTRSEFQARISPDGKKMTFGSNRTGAYEIWVTDTNGEHPVQLTFFGGPETGSPSWSPDSAEIAFDTRVDGNPDIYVVSAGGGKPRRLTTHPSDDFLPSWSHDGQWIYFTSNRGGRNEIWKLPSRGGAAIQVTHGGAFRALESTDGKYVYFLKGDGPGSLWRVSAGGGPEEEFVGGLWGPISFDVTAEGIYYVPNRTPEDPHFSLQFYSFRTGRSERLMRLDLQPLGIHVAPDRRWLFFSSRAHLSGDIMMIENFH